MSRGSVPRGSVGRAEFARDLEPGEIDESVPPNAAASGQWDPKDIGTKAKSPPPTPSNGGASQPAGGTIPTRSASAEAAIEVGAAVSTKRRCTYWEVSTVGKEVREQWTTQLEVTVKRSEEEAAAYWGRLSKRQTTKERAWLLGEHRNMARGDRESNIYMTIDAMHEQLRRYRSQEFRVEIPLALFKSGQSVLQWWAPWMKDAKETPPSYNKNNRPAWFIADVTSYCGYGKIKYAGQDTLEHLYHVY